MKKTYLLYSMYSGIGIFILAGIICYIFVTTPYVWFKIPSSVTKKSGKLSSVQKVYKNRTGTEVLVFVVGKKVNGEEKTYLMSYLIKLQQKEVLSCFSDFYFIGNYAFTTDTTVKAIKIPSAKIEINPKLVVNDEFIRFDGQYGEKIEVYF